MDILRERPPKVLKLRRIHWLEMARDVSSRANEEACGLVAEAGGVSVAVFPTSNVFHSPFRYQIDPIDQLKVFKSLDENRWRLLAIYHSHPYGPPELSESDIQHATYPEAAYLLWARGGKSWVCRGYVIEHGRVKDLKVITEPD